MHLTKTVYDNGNIEHKAFATYTDSSGIYNYRLGSLARHYALMPEGVLDAPEANGCRLAVYGTEEECLQQAQKLQLEVTCVMDELDKLRRVALVFRDYEVK